jgi:hypothetical protein
MGTHFFMGFPSCRAWARLPIFITWKRARLAS